LSLIDFFLMSLSILPLYQSAMALFPRWNFCHHLTLLAPKQASPYKRWLCWWIFYVWIFSLTRNPTFARCPSHMSTGTVMTRGIGSRCKLPGPGEILSSMFLSFSIVSLCVDCKN
jgi:hypothetical protein